jgi:hypothetical protein
MTVTGSVRSVTEIPDIEPRIPRIRAIIEGVRAGYTTESEIAGYLKALVDLCGMTLVMPVIAKYCDHGHPGWSAWAPPEGRVVTGHYGLAYITTSGFEFMEYQLPDDWMLATIDMYSCLPFDLGAAVTLTQETFAFEKIVSWRVPRLAVTDG